MGDDVGATSPQDELDEYKIVGPGDLEETRGGDTTVSAEGTHPGGMFFFVLFVLQLSVMPQWALLPLRGLSRTYTMGLRVTAEDTRRGYALERHGEYRREGNDGGLGRRWSVVGGRWSP